MASFTAGTTFTDGVANDVTAAKLGALVTNATPTSGLIQDRTAETVIATDDTILIGDASDSNNLKRMTVANILKAPLVSTSGTIDSLTTGTTTSTAQIVTSGTIATFNSTTGTITNLSATTSTFLGAITGSTNVVNVGSGQIYKDASGNVGIGTTSPSGKLHVNGQTYIQGAVSGGLASSTLIANASGQAQFWGLGPDVSTTGSMAFVVSRSNLTSSLQALTIDSSGNVGIGTTSPTSILNISKTGAAFPSLSNPRIRLDEVSSGRFGVIEFDSSTNLNIWGSDVGSGSIRFFNGTGSGTERLRIDSSGNVGIGTTTPAVRLDVSNGNILGKEILLQNGAASSPALGTTPSWYSPASGVAALSTNATERLRIDSSGNVGIGVTAPVNKLEVVGSFGRGAPVTKTGDFTLADTENWLIVNKGSSCTVTLPAASSWTGREFTIKVITAHTVVSASSNVVPRNSATAGTAILTNVAGSWATLVSNGTNWVIMCGS